MMMKKRFFFLALILSVCISAGAVTASVPGNDDIRQVLYGALDNAKNSLKNAPFAGKTVAVLPFPGNSNDILAGRLKNILTENGIVCIEAKEDPMWNEILKEIGWSERKSDILDPATLVKFGSLKAAQILLCGSVRVVDANADRVYAEIELHATDLATRQHVWGGTFACRLYKGKEMRGIVSLDNELRMILKKNFEEAGKSLRSPEFAGKLDKVGSVTVIPLAGDVDQYMTGLAIEMLTQTSHAPKNPQIPSLSQIRAAARDGLAGSDAVFYGAVRDLSKTEPVSEATADKKVQTTYTLHADIQLFMEDVNSGVILWSKTVTLAEKVTSGRDMTAAELAAVRQAKIDAVPESIKEDFADNWKSYLAVSGAVIGGVILLILLVIGIKAVSSYNNIR